MYFRVNNSGGLTPEEASRLYQQQNNKKVTPQGAKSPKKTKKIKSQNTTDKQPKASKKPSKPPIFAPHAETHTPTENYYPKPRYGW